MRETIMGRCPKPRKGIHPLDPVANEAVETVQALAAQVLAPHDFYPFGIAPQILAVRAPVDIKQTKIAAFYNPSAPAGHLPLHKGGFFSSCTRP